MEFEYFFVFVFVLHVIAALSFLLAVFFAIRLYNETDKGWYWLSLVLSAMFFAVPQVLRFILPPVVGFNFRLMPVVEEASGIIASLFFTLSCYGMYATMKHIRNRLEPGEGEERKRNRRAGARKK